ncbi:MAG TPA: hypothetical protein VL361_03640 [Candidatus Limnocylindrales bacterium]|jgi:hypothetical protein|nr:hypothetical protein [Candidatus Limnocylindrales bacterium]
MKTDGQKFLDELAALPCNCFDHRFAESSAKLGLGAVFDRNELKLLYEASLRALLCHLAINGVGTPGPIRAEEEPERRYSEQQFMGARELLYASPGWQNLAEALRERVESNFLNVFVNQENLAW